MFYVLDDNNNKIEAYNKEELKAVIEQEIADGRLTGINNDVYVSKLKCCVSGQANQIALITVEEYKELETNGNVRENTFYILTDDTETDDTSAINEELRELLNAFSSEMQSTKNRLIGGVEVRTVLFEGNASANGEITLNSKVAIGDVLEVQAQIGGQVIEQKFKVENLAGGVFAYLTTNQLCTVGGDVDHMFYGVSLAMQSDQTVKVGSGRNLGIGSTGGVSTFGTSARIYKISKVEVR